MIDFEKFFKSFHHAGRGLFYALKNEQNFRLEVFGVIAILILMFYYNVSWIKIILVSFLLLLALVLEIINTIFEEMTDFLSKNHRLGDYSDLISVSAIKDNKIKNVKDLAAAAVFLAGIFSLFIAIVIFLKI
ncbi:diacylglycerol kinase [Patescibacteria group bacterium]|nr:diacylglycerol kinase [Patescibacteria group bacterium]MBU3999727.1 diacylglycerol kinase [Patescibacteria group bacterium]MBU4057116.1 diacylglycerol kinase [Patescibacteria group bacterium]MBU4369016.1 diacylglycerol kinase [Patescibacteria group bacterium]